MSTLPRKILLSFTCLLLFALILEGFCRLVPLFKDRGAMPSDDVLTPDRELIWRLKPHGSGPFATNELGFRDTPTNMNAELKILLLGDSVSWGDGIHDHKLTFPWLLEQQLSATLGKSVEVINSAVPGYSTFQELRYLQLFGLQLKPDLILLQFCLNDVVERYAHLAEYGGDNIFIGIDTRHAIRGLHGWLLRNSRTYETGMRLAVRLARDQQEYQVEKLTTTPLSKELADAWVLVLDELDQVRTLAHTQNIPLILLIMPYRFQLEQPQSSGQPQEVLRRWAIASNVPAIDLLPHFAEYQQRQQQTPLFYDPSHLTIEGHALTTQILAAELARKVAPERHKP